ncbi:hypothetical protein ACN47E_007257 [Coniothyrium glycines]
MSQLPPQTLSIKRKRNEAPVDALRFDQSNTIKRQKSSQKFAYRRLTRPDDTPAQNTPPTPTAERRFHLEPVGTGAKRVFIEARPATETTRDNTTAPHTHALPAQPSIPTSPPRPRKRPGAGSALRAAPPTQSAPRLSSPSENDVRELEALSHEISRVDNLHIPLAPSPSKHKPRAPAKRFAERHPDKAASLDAHDATPASDPDAMDVDTDYVIDTFVREPLLPDAPLPPGINVGLLVLGEDDDAWWDGDSDSDREFATDDEDSNAEEHYANDYPEDELSEDDELGRDVYQKKYRHGSDDEEYDLENDDDDDDDEDAAVGSGEDEDDVHFRMTAGSKAKSTGGGYWGAVGQ